MSLPVKITRVHPDAVLPPYSTKGAAGFDIALVADLTVPARGAADAPSGLVFQTPPGYALFILERSSTYRKTGLMLANSVGLLDEDFRGPTDQLILQFFNPGDHEITIPKGTRIAQGVFLPVMRAAWEEAEAQGESRGGLGSTGHA